VGLLEAERSTGPLAESLHELKAPLNSLSGFLEMVAEGRTGTLNQQQAEFLGTALGEARRLKELIAALVESASAAERPARREPTDPATLLDTAVERARGIALSHTVTLRTILSSPDLPEVAVDQTAIQQVFANLLQNALRVAPSESAITLTASAVDDKVMFMIADRGPGLGQVEPEKLFERYVQGENVAAARDPGDVGLGLWLSRRIVEAHGGAIWAETRADGPGARFCFTLPAA
jgi:signal transduction histidine kinase